MRTTMYINTKLLEKLLEAADKVDVTKNKMISILISRIIKKRSSGDETLDTEDYYLKPVKYQKSVPGIVWKIEHINLEPIFYEKALDLRRHFKHSVSWFISYAIVNYLDELVEEMSNPEDAKKYLDNYYRNYIYIARMLGDVPSFVTILGFPDEKDLENFLIL